ncbi:MAG TPA: hypothetical protein VK923_19435 [Euzebyales bacterium]|nr:hypothetical protein [Euzebyales bacterium]
MTDGPFPEAKEQLGGFSDVVAPQVVALVVLLTSDATVDRLLLLGLHALGTREQATGRNADLVNGS